MKRLFSVCLSIAAAALTLTACGPSPEQACRENAKADCNRMWTCNSPVKVGDDEASCAQSLGAFCSLAAGANCGDPGKAMDCAKETQALSCEAYLAGTKGASCAASTCQ
jgi:hypothetical protein